MGLRHIVLFLIFSFAGASIASAQPWQIATPRQVLPVPADGSTINFPNVNLVNGMKYRVHASGTITVSNLDDFCDASYYHFIISLSPTTSGLKVRNSTTTEDWFHNFWITSGFQNSYQSSHIYDATIPSLGSPLSFRFFDRADPPSNYYSDNSGNILIDVARETPGIAIEKDTLDFGLVRVGNSKSLPDSIESYGIQGYAVDNVRILGASASKFSVSSQRVVPFVLTESTNEFIFTYTPTDNSRDSAEFHIYSSNGFGADKEKVIYLYGNGFNSQLTFQVDTLDFGIIRTGTTKTLPEQIINSNNVSVMIISVTAEGSFSPYSVAGVPNTVGAKSQSPISVTFAPTVDGLYFEKFDVATADGSTFYFYAKGGAGVPLPELEKKVLDFGRVIIGQSRTLTDIFGNDLSDKGPKTTADLNVVSTANTNPTEYIITTGNQGSKSYPHRLGEQYAIAFSPKVHIPLCANHDGQFIITYDDGTSTTITFKGCDHMPLDAKLHIDTLYYLPAGQEIDVTQRLTSFPDPFDSTLTPIAQLTEIIHFDPLLFDLVSVTKGTLINNSQWNLNTTPSSGAVAISITSSTLHFSASGSLLTLRFHAHDNAKVGQFTDLIQNGINYDPSNIFEPNILSSGIGRITISDICTPVRITSGNFATSIEQNNPNPFNPSTHLQFAVGKNSDGAAVRVRITLFDQLGRFAGVLIDEPKTPGVYDYRFDGSQYSSGAYIYVFEAGEHVERKTMLLVK